MKPKGNNKQSGGFKPPEKFQEGKKMAKIIELCKYFAIEESDEGRFLIDNWSSKKKRFVNIGKDNQVTYINVKYDGGYYSFKVTNVNGTGLMQLKGSILQYTDITGTKKCEDGILQLADVLVIPTEYEDVSVDHIFERFGVEFPIARKNAKLYDIFAKGHKLQNACGSKVFLNMQLSKATYIPQIISYRNDKAYVTSEFDEVIFSAEYNTFPELCFIKNADDYSSIRPSYEEYKLNIWMYNEKGAVGIVYLDDEKNTHRYILSEVPFSMQRHMYFINENYVIYDFHGVKYLYFKGEYAGTLKWFNSRTKHQIFLDTNKGVYLGQTFFDKKGFFDDLYLHVDSICDISESPSMKKVILRSGTFTYNFKYDTETGTAVK